MRESLSPMEWGRGQVRGMIISAYTGRRRPSFILGAGIQTSFQLKSDDGALVPDNEN